MSIKDVLDLFDAKLEEVFNRVAHDPQKLRDAMVKRIEKTREKFLATEPARGKKEYTIKNNVVAYSPTRPDGSPLVLGGKPTNHTPAERFINVLDNLKSSVVKGELDKELASDPVESAAKAPRAPRKPREGGSSGKGWSPERAAKYAETIEARRKAKEAAGG